MGSEYIAEFDIKNNTLVVKILDTNKIDKLKQGRLEKPNRESIENLSSGNRFATGRLNSIQIARAIAIINNDKFILGRFGFSENDVIQTMIMLGKNSVLMNGYDRDELQQMRQSQQQSMLRAQYGVRAMPSRGTR